MPGKEAWHGHTMAQINMPLLWAGLRPHGVQQGQVVAVRGMKGHPANDGDICVLPATSHRSSPLKDG